MTDSQRTAELYRFADVCVKSRGRRQCRGGSECARCPVNVSAHAANDKEAAFIYTSALVSNRIARENQDFERAVFRGKAALFLIIGLVVFFAIRGCAV